MGFASVLNIPPWVMWGPINKQAISSWKLKKKKIPTRKIQVSRTWNQHCGLNKYNYPSWITFWYLFSTVPISPAISCCVILWYLDKLCYSSLWKGHLFAYLHITNNDGGFTQLNSNGPSYPISLIDTSSDNSYSI